MIHWQKMELDAVESSLDKSLSEMIKRKIKYKPRGQSRERLGESGWFIDRA